MTVTVSFRADDEDIAEADRWAERPGVEHSEFLREVLGCHLARILTPSRMARGCRVLRAAVAC